eukprot:2066456-Prymnesium_polylepis.1
MLVKWASAASPSALSESPRFRSAANVDTPHQSFLIVVCVCFSIDCMSQQEPCSRTGAFFVVAHAIVADNNKQTAQRARRRTHTSDETDRRTRHSLKYCSCTLYELYR